MSEPTTTPTHGGAERRHFPRRNIALDVAFGAAGAEKRPSTDQLERTVTVNISAGGICLYTDVLYPVGAQLYVALTIPGQEAPVEFVGTVAWFQKVSQATHGYKLGVECSELSQGDRDLLTRVVEAPAAAHPTRAKKVLLVEDDAELVQALKVRLESAGFQVVTATEGLDALQKSRTERPHAIVLDLMLPKLNGYEVCRLLKFDQKFRHIPVIMVTARSRAEDRDLGFAVGADAYVTKPFNGTELLAKIDALVENPPG